MQELTDAELENVNGGAVSNILIDLSKLSSEAHYLYPTKSLIKDTDGTYKYDKTKGTRKQLTKSMGVVAVKYGTATRNYKTSKGDIVTLVHVTSFGDLGAGYVNKKVLDKTFTPKKIN